MARVLIIDPEPDLRLLAKEAVLELGHDPVLQDEDAGCAQIDVVLLAVFDGSATLARELRRRDPTLPIVYVDTRQSDYETGAVAPASRLPKPYTLSELQRALDQALQIKPET